MSDDKLVSDTLSGDTSNRRSEPSYCQYCRGGCDQDFSEIEEATGLFLYPSHPEIISSTIETAKETLSTLDPKLKWITWKNLPVVGQTIFCTICKAVRFSGAVICDVTTMNFNLMFEIGYAIGLEVPIVPIRDTTILTDKDDFGRLGLLDTIGYLDFQNSEQLATKIMERMPFSPLKFSETELNTSSPIYMVKSPIPTEGEVRLLSVWKKSHFRFRTYDSVETPRLSLHEAIKEIDASLGVVGHLLSPAREGAKVHNARVALFAGIAMALGKHVVLVQEGHVEQPIDYREIVLPYNNPNELEKMFEPFMLSIMEKMQEGKRREKKTSPRFLARLDLGDVAAENEIQALSSYFVPTAQFSEVKRGHARLVIGRKGTGKTAMFYALRNASHKGHSNLVLDLKPDGHQFTKLRETVLSALPAGLQEHTLVGFWNLILLSEIAHKIRFSDSGWAKNDPDRKEKYDKIVNLYGDEGAILEGDFSERLLEQVKYLVKVFQENSSEWGSENITQFLYTERIVELGDLIADYLGDKNEVWMLLDNLDKGWAVRGTAHEEIMVLRALLEATRKIQRLFQVKDIDFRCVVFIRNDIYELLLENTPDKGKDTAISLEWDDIELFKEIIVSRVQSYADVGKDFESIWRTIFVNNVGVEDSFRYIADRTHMRPRDLLLFVRRCIETAVNRGHDRVQADDIKKAEGSFSEDTLINTDFELGDVYKEKKNILYQFYECSITLTRNNVVENLVLGKISKADIDKVLELLVWFGFLGVKSKRTGEITYSHQVKFNIKKLLTVIEQDKADFVVHPVYREALNCTGR